MLLLLALAPAIALAGNHIDVQIGGLMSGPSRRTLDIQAARLSVSSAARQQPARTQIVTVPPSRVVALRELAMAILSAGPETTVPCAPSADRLIALDIAIGARRFAGPVYCPSPKTGALVDAIYDIPTVGPSKGR